MQLSLKDFAFVFLVASWTIAICNWTGCSSFSPDKYAVWEYPVLLSRIVVIGSALFAVGYAIVKVRGFMGVSRS